MSKKRMTLKELQEMELGILKSFHNFCEEHNLRYYLSGGTLLGAIRHKGFIPWDDDIDLCMPRPDYMKLVQILNDGQLDECHYLNTRYIDKDCPSSIIRICDNRTELNFTEYKIEYRIGCWIDIFPLDGLEDNTTKRYLHFKKMRVAIDLFICCLTKFGQKRRSKIVTILQYGLLPFLPFIRMIGYRRYLDWIDRIAKKCDYNTSEYVGVVGGRAVEREAMKKADMEPAILVDFEGGKFYTMKNYDEYLTNLYGDYMSLPPENERNSRHIIEVYWKEGQ